MSLYQKWKKIFSHVPTQPNEISKLLDVIAQYTRTHGERQTRAHSSGEVMTKIDEYRWAYDMYTITLQDRHFNAAWIGSGQYGHETQHMVSLTFATPEQVALTARKELAYVRDLSDPVDYETRGPAVDWCVANDDVAPLTNLSRAITEKNRATPNNP